MNNCIFFTCSTSLKTLDFEITHKDFSDITAGLSIKINHINNYSLSRLISRIITLLMKGSNHTISLGKFVFILPH